MTSQTLPIILNLIAAFFGALGQYFYKIGGQKLGQVPLYKNLPLIGGILMFCAVMGLFVAAYKAGGRINIVYPFYATTFAWGALIGVFVDREPWNTSQVVGLAIMMVGLIILALQTNPATGGQ